MYLSFALWVANRLLDGIDGPYARATGQSSDFGGFYDIVIDFTAYWFIPIGICWSINDSKLYVVWLYMMATFVINNVTLFFLSALIEKNEAAKKNYKHKEMTTLKMPPALIEGFETMVFYGIFLLFPHYCIYTFGIFGVLVTANIIQRLHWAYYNILG